jgi:transposase
MKASNAKRWRWSCMAGVKEVAAELGVSGYTIYEWKRKYFGLVESGGSSGQSSLVSGLPEDVEGLQKLVREQQRQIAEL